MVEVLWKTKLYILYIHPGWWKERISLIFQGHCTLCVLVRTSQQVTQQIK
jgi:hypothetical protein